MWRENEKKKTAKKIRELHATIHREIHAARRRERAVRRYHARGYPPISTISGAQLFVLQAYEEEIKGLSQYLKNLRGA